MTSRPPPPFPFDGPRHSRFLVWSLYLQHQNQKLGRDTDRLRGCQIYWKTCYKTKKFIHMCEWGRSRGCKAEQSPQGPHCRCPDAVKLAYIKAMNQCNPNKASCDGGGQTGKDVSVVLTVGKANKHCRQSFMAVDAGVRFMATLIGSVNNERDFRRPCAGVRA
jgi:hypothetical protein